MHKSANRGQSAWSITQNEESILIKQLLSGKAQADMSGSTGTFTL